MKADTTHNPHARRDIPHHFPTYLGCLRLHAHQLQSKSCRAKRSVHQCISTVLKPPALLLLVLALWMPIPVSAKTIVTDDWDRSGRLTLQSSKSLIVFDRHEKGVRLRHGIGSASENSILIVPFNTKNTEANRLAATKTGRSDGGHVEIRATFSNEHQEEIEATFLADPRGDLRVMPGRNCHGISVHVPIEHAVLPSRILDDTIYHPEEYAGSTRLHIPSEHLLMGLLQGGDHILVCAWPLGQQRLRLFAGETDQRGNTFGAVELEMDGKPAYLGVLSAPGIWHRQELQPEWLEKDMEIPWQRPFPARWKTHLFEAGERETAYAIRDEKGQCWRAGLGTSQFPIWFDQDKTFIHLSKKFPAKQPLFIYPLEGHENTPIAFVQHYLGELPSLMNHQRIQFPDSKTGMYPCDGHDYITRMFRLGLQFEHKEFLREGIDDLMNRTESMGHRLQDYEDFMDTMSDQLHTWQQASTPATELFLNRMRTHMEEIKQIHQQQMSDMTAAQFLAYQSATVEKAKALLNERGTEIYPEAAFLIEENHQAASLTEHVGLRVGGRARLWAQQVAWECTETAAAALLAKKIRHHLRQLLGIGTWHECVY